MKTVGLIAEYNPFHNGHKYHIEEAKRITGADRVIVVMSGNFVQRGAPAIFDKYTRARCAALNGADLVIELPVYFATASAEYFAKGAIRLLDQLGIVDYLCFGSECGDTSILSDIADILLNEPDAYKQALKDNLRLGSNYAKARSDAFIKCYPDYADILSLPNNILGIEYIKSIKADGSRIIPYAIKRLGNNYHDTECSHELSSATAIRSIINDCLNNSRDISDSQLQRYIPNNTTALFDNTFNNIHPMFENDFSSSLCYKLLNEIHNGSSLSSYFEVSEELNNRLINLFPQFTSFSDFAMLLKNKSLTYTRICRALIHILLDIKTCDIEKALADASSLYARILAYKETPEEPSILKNIAEKSVIPIITSLKTALDSDILSPVAHNMLNKDHIADDLYQHISGIKYNHVPVSEFKRSFHNQKV